MIGIANGLRDHGIGPGLQVTNNDHAYKYLKACRNCKTFRDVVVREMIKIGEGEIIAMSSSMTAVPENTGYQGTRYLDLVHSRPRDFSPYPHQLVAQRNIDKLFSKDDRGCAGLLIMPTGSGKTATTVTWLLTKMIYNGARVLWLTHRHQLINQAADAFISFAPLAFNQRRDNKTLRITCVSAQHGSMSCLGPEDDVMICSVNSVYHHLDALPFILGNGPIVVVVDEAHHTSACTYRKVLDCIKSICPQRKLIGLTATPTRMVDDERQVMYKYFDYKEICHVSLSELITKEILAKPEYKTIRTKQSYEHKFNAEDKNHLRQYGELSERILSEIADSKGRNSYIVDEYWNNRSRYGKTLIFAINQVHCVTLTQELKKKGVSCDYVISGGADNSEKIQKFKDGQIEVLVNVQIMTEGADIPNIQTIFLTRPTKSEGLIMQMVGRGLRGPKAGGTKLAYIIDFEDTWELFKGWLTARRIIEPGDIEPKDKRFPQENVAKVMVPFEVIEKIYETMILNITGFNQNSILLMPDGWYTVVDSNNNEQRVLVFPNQLEGYGRMNASVVNITRESMVSGDDALEEYFADINDPLPTKEDLEKILSIIRQDQAMPPYYMFKERDELDVQEIARQFMKDNVPPSEQIAFAHKNYEQHPVLSQMYDDWHAYYSDITRWYLSLIDPEVKGTLDEGRPVYFQPERQQWTPGPHYNLEEIYKKVQEDYFRDKDNTCSAVVWSQKPMSCWGFYRYSDRRIVISCLLDTPDVPQNVLEFLLYHELLHANDHRKHDKEFRKEEHLFPEFAACDHFLDTFKDKFEMQKKAV